MSCCFAGLTLSPYLVMNGLFPEVSVPAAIFDCHPGKDGVCLTPGSSHLELRI